MLILEVGVRVKQSGDAGTDPFPGQRIRRGLLFTGPAATLLYIGLDTFAARRHVGYDYAGQTISELSAVGAPTRPLWLPVASIYSLLMIAFSFGVWLSAGPRLALRVVALITAAVGIVGLLGWPFAPMHRREVLAAGGGTRSDRVHLVLGGVDAILFTSAAALGATTLGRRFRIYSILTILLLLGFGAAMSADSPRLAKNEPTPWIGIKERIAIFGSMIWMAVLGIALQRAEGVSDPRNRERTADA